MEKNVGEKNAERNAGEQDITASSTETALGHDRETVAIVGAAGKMGTRVASMLEPHPDYRVLYVENAAAGLERLAARGVRVTPGEAAAGTADLVVLAVPDTLVGEVAHHLVPVMKPGAVLVCLDPAAPYAGALPERLEVSFFLTHPSHPPLFVDYDDPEARRDYWGFGHAGQSIVNALIAGDEAAYARGERLARAMFGPILNSYRLTLEQIALLEPALSETVALLCVDTMREGLREVVRRGVPEDAARDFLLGHINVELAIWFGALGWQPSAGAFLVLEHARARVLQPDWRGVFEPEEVRRSVERIIAGAPDDG